MSRWSLFASWEERRPNGTIRDGRKIVEEVLRAINARYVNYDELLESSYKAYSDYLQRARELDRLGEVIGAIDDYDTG